VGIGYDIHRLTEGRRLVLGGVVIPHSKGLDGHSDADVLVHAIMDALLGAAGLRDIGFYFPPDNPDYANASSLALLAQVAALVQDAGYEVGNVDATVVAESPRLAEHVPHMRRHIAGSLGISADRVAVKATTNEGLGALGAGLGIAAWAVALLAPGIAEP
jgi:2-C-methyl-D-erythritol 2,4-cyclodiphosphate synthase